MSIFDRIRQVQYLDNENTEQYRPIIRIFYEEHLKFSSFLSLQEVYRLLQSSEFWSRFAIQGYDEKQLEADLKALVGWSDLEVIQDNTKATSYEDYQKNKYRYKVTDLVIDIERMLLAYEKKAQTIRGGLEKQLADRLLEELARIAYGSLNQEEVYYMWRDLMRRHEQLRNDTADFLSLINAESTEKLLRTESFIPFKTQFVIYLSGFVAHVAERKSLIQKRLREIPDSHIAYMIDLVIEYEKSAPQFLLSLEEYDQEISRAGRLAEWNALKNWFIDAEGRETGFDFLIKQTKGAISKIVRIAQQIAEKAYQYKSRKNDYLKVAKWFYEAEDIDTCHCIAAYMFGAQQTRHICASPKESDSITRTVWEHEPHNIELKRTNRGGGARKSRFTAHEDRMAEAALLNEHLIKEQLKKEMFARIVKDGKIRIRDIGVAHPLAREEILEMVGRATVATGQQSVTAEGRRFTMVHLSEGQAMLRCTDGTLTMNDIEIVFEEANDAGNI